MSNILNDKREMRSFIRARDPSIDRRFRPRPNKKLRLFDEIHETNESTESDVSDVESDYIGADDEATGSTLPLDEIAEAEETGPQVYLRLRPVDKPTNTYTIADTGTVLITNASADSSNVSANKGNMQKHYSFSTIFDSSIGQRDVYEKCVGQKIHDEESFTIMTYGTSGSGKTYTLLGDEVRAGIIPRAMENIFTRYARNLYHQPSMKLMAARLVILEDEAALKEMQIRRRIQAACPDIDLQHKRLQQIVTEDHGFQTIEEEDVSVVIWISFAEIYNELVYDLLALPPTIANPNMVEPPRKNLKIVCNNGQVFIKGLSSIYVRSSLEALKLLRLGQQRLTYASTAINSNSSRSHCVFFVDILKFYRSGETTCTSYKFCDLAGSERLDKTGNVGSRLKEAQRINTSLLVLGRCLDAASNTRKKTNDIIPFRESKLTMLLQESLLGKEKLSMIVTVTPLDKYYEENFNVLNFASIAQNIVFKQPPLKQHHSRYSTFMGYSQQTEESMQNQEYIDRLEKENMFLRASIDRLENENLNLREANAEHFQKMQELEDRLRKELTESFEKTLQSNIEQGEQVMNNRLCMQQRLHEAELASQKRKYEEQIEDLRDELNGSAEYSDVELID